MPPRLRMMPSSKCTWTGCSQPLPPLTIFQTSRVPGLPVAPPSVGPSASWMPAETRRGSAARPMPPSVLMVQGFSSVPSERPKMKVRCRAWARIALSVSRFSFSGIIFLPSGLAALPLLAGLAGSYSSGFIARSWPL
ncbi:hypothetical protein D3C81_1199310 [compost metagenome]